MSSLSKVHDKLKNAPAFNPTTELKKTASKVALRVEDIHEIVTLNY